MCELKIYIHIDLKTNTILQRFNMDQKISKTNCLSFNKLYSTRNMYTLYKTSAEDKRCSEMKYSFYLSLTEVYLF